MDAFAALQAFTLLLAVIAIGLALRSKSGGIPASVEVRLSLLERKVDQLCQNLGVKFEQPGLEQVRALLATGNKIEAIKTYREFNCGVGLKEAKDFVDYLEKDVS